MMNSIFRLGTNRRLIVIGRRELQNAAVMAKTTTRSFQWGIVAAVRRMDNSSTMMLLRQTTIPAASIGTVLPHQRYYSSRSSSDGDGDGPVLEEGQVVEKHNTSSSSNNKNNDESSLELEQRLQQALKHHQSLLLDTSSSSDDDDNNDDDNSFVAIKQSLEEIRDCYEQLEWWDDALDTEKALLEHIQNNNNCADNDDNDDNDSSSEKSKKATLLLIADCYGRMGRFYLQLEKFQPALQCCKTCLVMMQKTILHHGTIAFHSHVGRAMNDVARVLFHQNSNDDDDYGEALDMLRQAEDHYRYHGMTTTTTTTGTSTADQQQQQQDNMPPHPELFKVLENQGLIYRMNDRHDVALVKYQEALELVKDNDEQQIMKMSISIADCYASLGQLGQAIEIYQDIVDDMEKQGKEEEKTGTTTMMEGVLRHNIGLIHSQQGRLELAMEEFMKAYHIKKQMGGESHPEVATTLNGLGATCAAMGNMQDALSYFRESLLIARIHAGDDADNDPNVMHALRNIAVVQGDSSPLPSFGGRRRN